MSNMGMDLAGCHITKVQKTFLFSCDSSGKYTLALSPSCKYVVYHC